MGIVKDDKGNFEIALMKWNDDGNNGIVCWLFVWMPLFGRKRRETRGLERRKSDGMR